MCFHQEQGCLGRVRKILPENRQPRDILDRELMKNFQFWQKQKKLEFYFIPEVKNERCRCIEEIEQR